MEFYRIQDKMISKEKIITGITRILDLRARGLSQQEVANRLGIDRTFVSRLETLGEIRKGRSIAVVGFPILNKEEISRLLEEEGVDYAWLMTERERNDYVQNMSGAKLLNDIMDRIALARTFDVIIILASDFRLNLIEKLLDNEVISIQLGTSPLTEDKWVDPGELRRILRAVKEARNTGNTRERR